MSKRIGSRTALPALALLLVAALGQATDARASLLYAAVTDGSFYGVATLNESLGLISQVELSVLNDPISALAAGNGGTYYVGSANHIYQFDATGTVLHSITGSSTTSVPALSFDGTLYAGVTDQSFFGFATLNENVGLLGQTELTALVDPLSALAAGPGDSFFAAAGNRVYQFDADGNVLHSITGSSTTEVPALSYVDGVLYAAVTDGSFYGVATLDDGLGLLDQMELLALTSPISGLAAGLNGEFYVGSANVLRQFDADGNVLHSITGSSTTLIPALSFFDSTTTGVGVAEPATLGLFALGLAGLVAARRRKA